jgi:hypothetical protein
MSSAAELHMLYRIGNAPILPFPFPHIYVRDVFPADFYAELVRHLPPREAFAPISDVRPVTRGAYDETRSVLVLQPESVGKLPDPQRGVWERMARMLLGGELGNLVFAKFGQFIQARFQNQPNVQFFDEALLVQDSQNYALGPHTDTPLKVISFLFYLPADDSQPHLGTSIYVPKDRQFTCPGGPHYPFDRFDRMLTMPYVPNALFAFLKTPNAFHGVEPVNEAGVQRNLLLYDVRIQPPQQAQPKPAAGPAVQFKF